MINYFILFFILSTVGLGCSSQTSQNFLEESLDAEVTEAWETSENIESVLLVFKREYNLVDCSDQKLGFKILCNPNWELIKNEKDIQFIISKNSFITLRAAQLDWNIHFLGQLNKEKLSVFRDYKEGFQTEYVQIDKREALKVKAFSSKNPHVRYLEYYFLNQGRLYGIQFYIDPKEEWENYKFFIERLAHSFKFLT